MDMNYNNKRQDGQSAYPDLDNVVNYVNLLGTVKARTREEESSGIRYYPFQNGGGAIHFTLVVVETRSNRQGGTTASTMYITINAYANVNYGMRPEYIQSIRPGMKIRVEGKLKMTTRRNQQGGTPQWSPEVDADKIRIIEMQAVPQTNSPQFGPGGYIQYPQPQQPQQYQPQYTQQYQPQYGQQPAVQQGGYPAPQGYQQGYQQQPQYGPAPSKGQGAQGGYPAPAPAYQPQRQQPQQPARQERSQVTPPPYYQAPQTQGQGAQDDMPADIEV